MTDQFLGEIRMFGGTFAPTGWATCDGQLMPISQNTALFSLLGTQFGGDGRTTFALPDLRARLPVHQGNGAGLTPRTLGESGGSSTVALIGQQLPPHTHQLNAFVGRGPTPAATPAKGDSLTTSVQGSAYASGASANAPMNPAVLSTAGGGQPHNNMMPSQSLMFIIALQGIFPARQ
jgi:microcystin-dependent protein